VIIISAISKNGIIGTADGKMPWHVKEEFIHFKNTTLGFPIIMGRKTFESLEAPLKGRLNIVITRSNNLKGFGEGIKIRNSISGAIDLCKNENNEKAFIIGGREIYEQAITLADEMILSFMKFDAKGTIFFPKYDKHDWLQVSENEHEQFTVVHFVRKGKTG